MEIREKLMIATLSVRLEWAWYGKNKGDDCFYSEKCAKLVCFHESILLNKKTGTTNAQVKEYATSEIRRMLKE